MHMDSYGGVSMKRRRRKGILLFLIGIAAAGAVVFFCERKEPEISLQTIEPEWVFAESEAETGFESWETAEASGAEAAGGEKEGQTGGGEEEWSLELVNRWNPMKSDGSQVETVTLSNGERIDARIYPQLQKMFDTARESGVYPVVASGYRTWEEQEALYNEKIAAYEAEGFSREEARTEAERWVAVPGTSEHQLGLGVDINADGIHSSGDEVYNWLAQNAYRFGFIYRYPLDKTEITGIANEPWHYRYVGIEAAQEIYSQGVCLEEYLGAS